MAAAAMPLLESFSALADSTRCRMLLLLDRHELTVSEVCAVLQLPQSTVSRHLRILADADWVESRRDGTSRYYSLALDGSDGPRAALWALTRTEWTGRPGADQDGRRLVRVLAQRSQTSQHFFSSAAAQWDQLRDELFGRESLPRALLALLPPEWTVGDLGCGTGATMAVLAPLVRRVIGVDSSEDMLSAARTRVGHLPNTDLRHGTLEALPLDDAALDAATMMLVLHHLPSPAIALAEAARVLKPGGRLLIVDMAPHEHEEYRQQMGHVWLGFAAEQVHRLLQSAGFDAIRVDPLPPATDAKGPALFAAVASHARRMEGV
jgi:ArsR family transcriptional regulator